MSKKTERLFGVHAVEQLLKKSPETILHAWIQQPHKSGALQQIQQQLGKYGVHVESISRHAMDSMVSGRHQGIIIEIRTALKKHAPDLTNVIAANQDSNPLYLLLDSVQDPHNLGACIRTAVAAGVSAVVIPKDRAVGVNETVRKVASGGVEEMEIVTVTNLVRAMQELKQAGVWLVGTSGRARQSIYDIDMTAPTAIVMGGEDKGLRDSVEKECDYLAAIPLLGDIESLNVSVAAGVALYEAVRQRRQP